MSLQVSVLVPFWYVKPTMDPELVTMVLSQQKHGSITIPMFTNSRALKAGEVLLHAAEALIAKEASQQGCSQEEESKLEACTCTSYELYIDVVAGLSCKFCSMD